MTTPLESARGALRPAFIEVLYPERSPRVVVPLRFNPTDYQLQKGNAFQEIAVPGLESPPIQYVRGNSARLSFEAFADTSDTLEDVREKYVTPIRSLLDIDPELHAPPIVRFVWRDEIFRGVLESLQTTYVLFTPDGVPIRARLSLAFKEYRPAKVQVRERPKASADFAKTYVVRAGDTLASIAAAAYKDAGQWRAVARANGVQDPRRLRPGLVLTIPRTR